MPGKHPGSGTRFQESSLGRYPVPVVITHVQAVTFMSCVKNQHDRRYQARRYARVHGRITAAVLIQTPDLEFALGSRLGLEDQTHFVAAVVVGGVRGDHEYRGGGAELGQGRGLGGEFGLERLAAGTGDGGAHVPG